MNPPRDAELRQRRLALALLIPAVAVMLLALAGECWRVLAPAQARAELHTDVSP